MPLTDGSGRRTFQFSLSRPVSVAVTAVLWIGAAVSWTLLYRDVDAKPGADLLYAWRAEKLFAAGSAPYAVKGFVYPPSSLLLLRPLAWLSEHQLVVGGLVATMVIAWIAVIVTSSALKLVPWGATSAVTVLLVSFTGSMRGEVLLENVSILQLLAVALFYKFAISDRWLAAATVLGLSLAVKPILLPVLMVFALARKWRALALAVGVPLVLNLIALAVVHAPGQVIDALPSIFDRRGPLVIYNSAWVGVAHTLGIPEAGSVAIRVVMTLASALAAWWAWQRLEDGRLRLVTTTSALLIGLFTAGTLSEYHFCLTLIPFAMTVVLAGSPARVPTALLGVIWSMNVFQLPSQVLGLSGGANDSAYRAIGMSMVVLTIVALLGPLRALRRPSLSAPSRVASPGKHGASLDFDHSLSERMRPPSSTKAARRAGSSRSIWIRWPARYRFL